MTERMSALKKHRINGPLCSNTQKKYIDHRFAWSVLQHNDLLSNIYWSFSEGTIGSTNEAPDNDWSFQ